MIPAARPVSLDSSRFSPYLPLMPQSSEEILDELFRGVGRAGKRKQTSGLRVAFERELGENDLRTLASHQGIDPQPVKRLRHSHHMLAKLLADGVPQVEISLMTGFCTSRISILKRDPAFQELIAYYDDQKREIYLDVHQQLADFGLDTLGELRHRLETEPENFKNEELVKQLTAVLDRSGYGPTSTLKHTGGVALLTDEALTRLKAEAEARRVGAVRTLSGVGEVIDSIPVQPPSAVREAEEGEGDEGERAGV